MKQEIKALVKAFRNNELGIRTFSDKLEKMCSTREEFKEAFLKAME